MSKNYFVPGMFGSKIRSMAMGKRKDRERQEAFGTEPNWPKHRAIRFIEDWISG